MRYIKIRFLDWRHAGETAEQRSASASMAVLRVECEQKERTVARLEASAERERRALTAEEATERQALVVAMEATRQKIMQEEARYKAAREGQCDRVRIGTLGYQEIDDAGNLVRLTDENGNAVPTNIVVGYEVVDEAPPTPSWSTPPARARA